MKKEDVVNNLGEVVEKIFRLPDGRPLKLTHYQEEFVKQVLKRNKKKHLFIAATRVGKTTAACVLSVLSSILYDREEVTIVSPIFDQALNIFKTVRGFFYGNQNLRRFVNEGMGYRRDEINLVNGSVLRIRPASSPEGLLSFGATMLVVDECASIPDEVYRTRILRMLAGRAGRSEPVVVLLSTPHRKNFFYDAYVSGEYEVYKVTWRDAVAAGILDKFWVEEAKKMMTEQEFKVWFEAEFPEETGEMFSMKMIEELAVLEDRSEPNHDLYEYFMGLDIARYGFDESAIVIIAVPKYEESYKAIAEVAYFATRSKASLVKTISWAVEVADKWRVRNICVDMTGMGAGVYDILSEKFGQKIIGVDLGGSVRNDVYKNLQMIIEEARIRLPRNPKFISQFTNFRIESDKLGRPRIVKGERGHDDLVDALAFACWAWNRGNVYGRATIFEELMRL